MVKNSLKKILQEEGIQQTELNNASSVSLATINKVCNNKRDVSPTIKAKLVKGVNSLLKENKYTIEDIFKL